MNKDFYPTPQNLIIKMMAKINNWHEITNVLEPSAGRGDILDYIKEGHGRMWGRDRRYDVIEIERDMQAILKDKEYNLVETDFLQYHGSYHYDLIVANFPFSEGDKHLLHALNLLQLKGQMVCLVNAQTLKNPHTRLRKELVKRLKDLNAEVEYLQGTFLEAERKTEVEVALIHVKVETQVESLIDFNLLEDKEEISESVNQSELTQKSSSDNLVRMYEITKERGTNAIVDFYKNTKILGKYITLSVNGSNGGNYETLTQELKAKLNSFYLDLRRDFWTQAFSLDEIAKRLTSKKQKELLSELEYFSKMEFSKRNLAYFTSHIVDKYPKMMGRVYRLSF